MKKRRNILGVVHTSRKKRIEHNKLLREKLDVLVEDNLFTKDQAEKEFLFWKVRED